MSPPTTFDILGFGAVAVDDLLYVDEFPRPDQKMHVLKRERQGGGNTGTALVAAARLGARCAYVGRLGDDELSRSAIQNFRREGIDTQHVARRPDGRPFHSTIIVDQKQHTRTILASLDGVAGADPSLPDPRLIREARVLLIDHHGIEGTLRAVRLAREAKVAVVADFERDPGWPFTELLAQVDHLIVSEQFAAELSGEKDPALAARRLWTEDRSAVVVTCGASGCWYSANGANVVHHAAFPVPVVDTTGCGDVFHGAYAAALAKGADLPSRIAIASATAALKATQPGGQAGCPTWPQVDRFLQDP